MIGPCSYHNHVKYKATHSTRDCTLNDKLAMETSTVMTMRTRHPRLEELGKLDGMLVVREGPRKVVPSRSRGSTSYSGGTSLSTRRSKPSVKSTL